MIAGQDQDLRRTVSADDVEILVDGICRASVPLTADALRGGQYFDKLLAAQLEPGPAVHEMADQRVCLVLCQDADATNARIEAVR